MADRIDFESDIYPLFLIIRHLRQKVQYHEMIILIIVHGKCRSVLPKTTSLLRQKSLNSQQNSTKNKLLLKCLTR